MPVFFWIHGGAFTFGAGSLYNGSRLARQGIVVVSINYRLGAFGYFASEEIRKESPSVAPSNGGMNGLLDQLAALRWVRAHIAAFHGDPDKVTIGGESAGSLSTCMHLHAPPSQTFFSRAVLESGSCIDSPWGWGSINSTAGQVKPQLLMDALQAASLADMRRIDAEKLFQASVSPGIDGFGNPSPDGFFLQDHPSALPVLTQNTEIIVGSNSMDTLWAPPYLTTLEKGLNITIPSTASEYKTLVRGHFGDAGLALYPGPDAAGSSAEAEVRNAFYRISSDVCNTCPMHWMAQKLVGAADTVYAYHFGFEAEPSLLGLACHSCEISDVFDLPLGVIPGIPHDPTLNGAYNPQLGAYMSAAWAAFVKQGKPSPDWPVYKDSISKASVLHISTLPDGQPQIRADTGLASKQCSFFADFMAAGRAQKQLYMDFCNRPAVPNADVVVLFM